MMTTAARIRVMLADDHRLFRDGLKAIFAGSPDLEVVGEAADGDEVKERVRAVKPDVLLLDMDMPRQSGLETLREIAPENHPVRTIILTGFIEREQLVEALQLGARGVVRKDEGPDLLAKCIRSVMAGELWVGRQVVADLVRVLQAPEKPAEPAGPRLTAREREVLEKVTAGATNRDIARELRISEDTVKRHMSHIFDKTGVSNRLELALFALNRGGAPARR
jgi:two-component system nitrate/nitrite response regulator NarL